MAISEHFHLNPTKAVDSAFCCKGEARRTEAIQGKMRCLPLLFFCQILIYHYLSLLEQPATTLPKNKLLISRCFYKWQATVAGASPLLLAADKGPASLVIIELTSFPHSSIPPIKVSAINSSEPSPATFVSLQTSWKCSFFPCVVFMLFSALGLYLEEASPGGLQEVLGIQEFKKFWATRSRTVSYNLYPGEARPPSLSAATISFNFAKGTCIYSSSMTQWQGQCQGMSEVS